MRYEYIGVAVVVLLCAKFIRSRPHDEEEDLGERGNGEKEKEKEKEKEREREVGNIANTTTTGSEEEEEMVMMGDDKEKDRPPPVPKYFDEESESEAELVSDNEREEVEEREKEKREKQKTQNGDVVVTVVDPSPSSSSSPPLSPPPLVRQESIHLTFTQIKATKPFRLLLLANFFGSFGYGTPFIHVVPYARDQGISKGKASVILSLFGLASLFGRISLGYLADKTGRIEMLKLSALIMGVSSLLWPFLAVDFWQLSIFAIVYGFTAGAFISLPPSIAAMYFGVKNIAPVVGYLFFVNAIGSVAGPVFAGLMYDESGNYDAAGVFTGVSLLSAALTWHMLPTPKLMTPPTMMRSSSE